MNVSNAISGFRRLVTGPGLATGARQAVVLAVAAQKGGVGKTTTAVHLAAGLAAGHGRRVLLIDLDAQAHVAMSLRQQTSALASDSLSNVLLQKRRDIEEIATRSDVEGLFVVPSDRGLSDTEQLMATRIGKELLLEQALRVARTHYDVIVMDCPPNLGGLTVNALVAADFLLVPCDLSLLSLDGVSAIIETVVTVQETFNPDLDLLGMLRTRVDRRNQTVNAAIEDTLRQRYGRWLLESEIGVATDITKAQLAGETVYAHAPRGRAAKSYMEFCGEIDDRLFRGSGPLLT